ncbi:hypothetical protein [Phocoenobacter atlanticus]|uniref:hypothetical protein n=1 Tax=Phocoenobacter atlanticus TaxID=3416742 RepID=UPI002745647B|nr:hypothetical protein [Pasteurella atlantica]MDP8100239.1 hypothetical protein [Pasteurella atlantica]
MKKEKSVIPKYEIIDELFEELEQWGLRGDPYLWRTLKERFKYSSISNTEEFHSFLIDTFKDKAAGEPTKDKNYYVKEFNFGGMSSGGISSNFWIEKGFPLLIKRYKQLSNRK